MIGINPFEGYGETFWMMKKISVQCQEIVPIYRKESWKKGLLSIVELMMMNLPIL